MSIATQVENFKQNVASKAPPEIGGVFTAEQHELAETTDRSTLVAAGDTIAAFTLPDASGRQVSLDDLVAEGLAVLVFYRGAWCPYCNIMLAAYAAELAPALVDRGVTLAAISPQLPDGSLTVQQKYELAFPVLSDVGNVVAEPLGIVWSPGAAALTAQRAIDLDVTAVNGTDEARLPMPTVLVVDRERSVRWADVRPDYTERAEVADILAAVDATLNHTS